MLKQNITMTVTNIDWIIIISFLIITLLIGLIVSKNSKLILNSYLKENLTLHNLGRIEFQN